MMLIEPMTDVDAATKLGIVVVNSPSGNIGAAAEHTIALLMALARNIPDACSSIKAGKWERSRLVGVEVKGKTLGIIGLGKGTRTSPSSPPQQHHLNNTNNSLQSA